MTKSYLHKNKGKFLNTPLLLTHLASILVWHTIMIAIYLFILKHTFLCFPFFVILDSESVNVPT